MNEKKCPACGASVDFNATECKYCGEALPISSQENQAYQEYQGQQGHQGNSYLKPYYQEEFQKISESNEAYKGKWNWCAFFFSWIWAFTKGLWGLALVNIGVNIFLGSINLTWLNLVICVFWGLRGNYCYYNLEMNKKQFPNKL